ncbi:MAG: ABC transporter substrate-binding protein [Lentisphaeria bacterium]|nr:ABC transporter substrate-binding protein [Lentisphaeria bacterium]
MKTLFFAMILFFSAALSAAPVKLVSLSPAVSDAIVLIGGKAALAGRSSACNAPEISAVPIAGVMGRPEVERVIKLQPDFVVSDTMYPGNHWQVLERAKIKVIFLPGEKISDFPANLRYLGKLLKLEKSAQTAAENFEQQIAALKKNPPARQVQALIIFGVSPAISCSKKSFITEALTLAGVQNICADGKRAYFAVSSEYILRHNPELIISAGVPEAAVKSFFARAEFRHLKAVKQRRIISIDPDRFCRAGKNLPQAINALRQQIQQIYSPGAADLPSR